MFPRTVTAYLKCICREIDHIYMTVHPATAGNPEEQFVCAHIYITLPDEVNMVRDQNIKIEQKTKIHTREAR